MGSDGLCQPPFLLPPVYNSPQIFLQLCPWLPERGWVRAGGWGVGGGRRPKLGLERDRRTKEVGIWTVPGILTASLRGREPGLPYSALTNPVSVMKPNRVT